MSERSGRWRVSSWFAGAFALFVLGFALLLAPLVHYQINERLADLGGGYVGHVENLSIDWLSRRMTLHALRIERPEHRIEVPFLVVERIEIELFFRSWAAPRIRLSFVSPSLSFVDSAIATDQQWGPQPHLDGLRKSLPFELGAARFLNTQVLFRDLRAQPAVDTYMHHLNVEAAPLDDCFGSRAQGCRADVRLDGKIMATGTLRAQARLENTGDFQLRGTAEARAIDLPRLNSVLLRYADVDVQRGKLDLDLNTQLDGGHYRLMIVPRFEALSVRGAVSDPTRTGRKMLLALIAGVVGRGDGNWRIVVAGDRGRNNLAWKLEQGTSEFRDALRAP